jgi:ATP-dependent helicase/nuclease subunit A
MPPDHPVRTRIAADLDTNVLVEAGAGSGKTHSLAERMAAGIARGRYDVDHMAAVTFTRKAAAELRGRFQAALEQRLVRASGDEGMRLTRALSGLERFFAGTIHAFCARLIRERPVESQIAPGFVELDEVDDGLRRDRAWHDYVVRESARGSPALLELRGAGVRPGDLDQAFAVMCEHADVCFDAGDAEPPDPTAAWTALDRFWASLSAEAPTPIDAATKCKVQRLMFTFPHKAQVARRQRPADLARLLEDWRRVDITKKWWGNRGRYGNHVAERAAAELQRFQQDIVVPFLQDWRAWLYRVSMTLLGDARRFYAAERRRHNIVNYVDLLMVAARLLRERHDVRHSLQQKYRWLFVDEFQDTDPLQAEVFMLLAADGDGADWMTVPLRPGALFVVGDPKQSIYRFRRADIDVYNLVQRRLTAGGGEVLTLTANFRSRPPLCEFANRVFSKRFPESPTPHAPRFERLEPVRPPEGPAACLCTLTLPAREVDDPAAWEADRIAAWIQGEVDQGRRRYGDVLVLTRTRGRLGVYGSRLEAAGIPVEVSGAGMFGGSPEVAAVHALLNALADPLDGVGLVGVLRGPLFGISDADLFRYRRAGGRFDLATPLPEPEGSRGDSHDDAFGPALGAMRQLQRLLRRTRQFPLGAVLDLVLEETGLLALAATTPGGAAAGDLLQAIDRVRHVAETGGGLADAADALSEDAREASDVETRPLEPGRRDVVRVMNLHRAKGLEAEVVFLADPSHGGRTDADVHIVRAGDGARGWLQVTRRRETSWSDLVIAQPRGWAEHEAAEKRYLVAEQERLLYVAATRARELLVVGRCAARKETHPWAVLDPFLTDVPELPVASPGTHDALSPTPRRDVSPLAETAAMDRLAARHAVVMAPSWAVASATEDGQFLARAHRIRRSLVQELAADAGLCPSEPAEPRSDAHVVAAPGPTVAEDPTASLLPGQPGHRADAGAAWGSLIHGLLEFVMRHPDASHDDLARLARWLIVEHPDLRSLVPQAITTVDAVRRASFWAEAQASGAVQVEVPFATAHAAARTPTPAVTRPDRPSDTLQARAASRRRSRASMVTDGQPSLLDLLSEQPPEPATGKGVSSGSSPAPPLLVLRGVIDLVYHVAEGWHIVDYKTDDVVADAGELVARYGGQVARYAGAWAAATGEPVVAAALFSTRRLQLVEVR